MSSVYKQSSEAAGVELSQWQLLREKMSTYNQEKAPVDADVDKLLKSIFTDHALADYPDFVKYFKNERRGKPMEDRLLRKAAASATAAQQHHYQQQQQLDQHPHPRFRRLQTFWHRDLEFVRRGLARYRAWPPRVRLYLLLCCPEYSPHAMAIAIFMMAVIILNTVTFCMESVPSFEDTSLYHKLIIIDYVCLGIFTVEFMLRLLTCNNITRFALKLMNWLDLAAIAPFLIELAVAGPDSQDASQTRIFRLVRLVRIVRLLRASSRFRNLQLVVDALYASLDVIGMLAVLLGILLVVAGTIVFYVEGALVKDTWFDSIPLTMYYMHVTLTTTGYGDYYAKSVWGRLVVGTFMLLCMVTVSLPIGVVGGNFSNLWTRYVALRDAIGRSLEAWATRKKLRGLAGQHCAAVDELVTATLRLKGNLEEGSAAATAADAAADKAAGKAGDDGDSGGLVVIRDSLMALHTRLHLLVAEGEGTVDGEQKESANLASVRGSILDLRRRLVDAEDQLGHLQALLSLVPRVSSADVAASLDGLHAVHQTMAQRATEGVRQAGLTRQVLADLRAMREVLREEEDEVYGMYDSAYGDGDGVDGAAAVGFK